MLSFSALLFLSIGAAQAAAEPEVLVVEARLPVGPLAPGPTHTFVVTFELADGWDVPGNPLLPKSAPAPMLQIDVPAGVELVGEEARTLDELLGSAFLDLPFERMLTESSTEIAFRLRAEPAPEAAFEFNALLYAVPDGAAASTARLVRQRYRLELRPGAIAERIPATESRWGRRDVLQLGETVPHFDLPTPVEETLALDDVLGAGLVVLTTYRSCL